jgi:hypothetical protein
MPQIFISHSSRDRDFVVAQLKPALEASGFVAWCSSTDLKTAANWEQQIRAALARSDWFAVVLSPDAQRSEWVQAETHWALEHLTGRVIPIMARSCRPIDLHLRLGTLQFIDCRLDLDAAIRELSSLIEAARHGAHPQSQALTVADGSELTTLVEQSRRASLLLRVLRVHAPEYEERLVVNNFATIGRSPQAHLRVDDDCVSRRHARIDAVRIDGTICLTVMDLDSANGTFLNGELVQVPRRIAPGDVVAVGSCKLHVREIAQI